MKSPEVLLQLRNPEQDIKRLLLFYEISTPLAKVLGDIGPVESPTVTFTTTRLPSAQGLEQSPTAAFSTSMLLRVKNVPEPLFERLALRFRPFYLQGEPVNFLAILNLLKAKNPELRSPLDEIKKRWHDALLWNSIEIQLRDTSILVGAESMIRCGFYSRYFHVQTETRAEAARYEAAMGKELFWAALISSVWKRSALVVDFARQLRPILLAQSFATETELAKIEEGDGYPSEAVIEIRD